jgi:hypothetical protein
LSRQGVDRKSQWSGQTDAIDPKQTLNPLVAPT